MKIDITKRGIDAPAVDEIQEAFDASFKVVQLALKYRVGTMKFTFSLDDGRTAIAFVSIADTDADAVEQVKTIAADPTIETMSEVEATNDGERTC